MLYFALIAPAARCTVGGRFWMRRQKLLPLPLDNNNNQARMYFFKIILCLSYFFRLSLGHMRITMCWAWVVSLFGYCVVFLIIMNLPTANLSWCHFDNKMFSTVIELSRFQTRPVSHFRDPKALTFKTRLSAKPFLWKRVIFAWE